MKNRVFIILMASLFSIASFSQSTVKSQVSGSSYNTAIGVKFYPGAFSVKHFVNNKAAVEGLLYFWNYGSRVTALYEFHFPIAEVSGLKWYAGPGAHIGFWNGRWREFHDEYYIVHEYRGSYFGIDGVLGLDYKFKKAPINLSLDWQPSFNFGNGPDDHYGFYSGFGGLGIRYTF